MDQNNSILNDYMLDHRGISEMRDELTINVCSLCSDSLKNAKIPKFSLRNGFYTGARFSRSHFDLPDLNWFEEIVISRVHFNQ